MSDEAKTIKQLKQAEKDHPMAPRQLFKPVRALIFAVPTVCFLWGAFLVLTRPLPVEPTYTPAQVAIASPTFLAMATAVPLQATPTLAPTATDTATPTNTATGTASATPTATNTGTPTAKPTHQAFAIIKMVTATPAPPLPPLDFEPLRTPVSVVGYVFTAIVLWVCAFFVVSTLFFHSQRAKAIAAAASMSRPSPSSEIFSPPTGQPLTINVYASQPVTRAPLAEDEEAITVWPDVSEDFSPRGQLASPPTPEIPLPENRQNEPVPHVTRAQNSIFERVKQFAPGPVFALNHELTADDWQEVHTFLQWCVAAQLGKGEGGQREWCYRILWRQPKSGGSEHYKTYSQKMDELEGVEK